MRQVTALVVLRQNGAILEAILSYKIAACGGALVDVAAAFIKQSCSHRGVVDAANRKGNLFS